MTANVANSMESGRDQFPTGLKRKALDKDLRSIWPDAVNSGDSSFEVFANILVLDNFLDLAKYDEFRKSSRPMTELLFFVKDRPEVTERFLELYRKEKQSAREKLERTQTAEHDAKTQAILSGNTASGFGTELSASSTVRLCEGHRSGSVVNSNDGNLNLPGLIMMDKMMKRVEQGPSSPGSCKLLEYWKVEYLPGPSSAPLLRCEGYQRQDSFSLPQVEDSQLPSIGPRGNDGDVSAESSPHALLSHPAGSLVAGNQLAVEHSSHLGYLQEERRSSVVTSESQLFKQESDRHAQNGVGVDGSKNGKDSREPSKFDDRSQLEMGTVDQMVSTPEVRPLRKQPASGEGRGGGGHVAGLKPLQLEHLGPDAMPVQKERCPRTKDSPPALAEDQPALLLEQAGRTDQRSIEDTFSTFDEVFERYQILRKDLQDKAMRFGQALLRSPPARPPEKKLAQRTGCDQPQPPGQQQESGPNQDGNTGAESPRPAQCSDDADRAVPAAVPGLREQASAGAAADHESSKEPAQSSKEPELLCSLRVYDRKTAKSGVWIYADTQRHVFSRSKVWLVSFYLQATSKVIGFLPAVPSVAGNLLKVEAELPLPADPCIVVARPYIAGSQVFDSHFAGVSLSFTG